MPCRSPGGSPGPRLVGEVEESGQGGLQAHTQGGLQADTREVSPGHTQGEPPGQHWGGCVSQHALRQTPPPCGRLLLRAVRILRECILVYF